MVRKFLLGFAALCVLFFTGMAIAKIYPWYRSDERAWAEVSAWRVIELNPSKFAIEADYSFNHEGKIYEGTMRFPKPYPWNRPSAEQEVQKQQGSRQIVYFDPGLPSRSSLEHKFPLKKCLNALLTLGIFLYFFALLTQQANRRQRALARQSQMKAKRSE